MKSKKFKVETSLARIFHFTEDDTEAENQKIRADLKLAFRQALEGKTISREELRRRMAEE